MDQQRFSDAELLVVAGLVDDTEVFNQVAGRWWDVKMFVGVVFVDTAGIVAMLFASGEQAVGGVADVRSIIAIVRAMELVHHVCLLTFRFGRSGSEYGTEFEGLEVTVDGNALVVCTFYMSGYYVFEYFLVCGEGMQVLEIGVEVDVLPVVGGVVPNVITGQGTIDNQINDVLRVPTIDECSGQSHEFRVK